MQRMGGNFKLVHFSEDPAEGDTMPVKLENPPAFDSGEDLVKIYSYPNEKDFDPSPWVLYCFAIFFGMIIGDLGYGIVLLLLTGYVHRKVGTKTPMARRLIRLMYLLSFSVMIWGVVGAGFFGMTIPDDHILKRLSLMDYGNPEGQAQIMIIAIIIGMLHISLSMMIRLFKERDLSCLGWVVAIWGGYFLLNSQMAHKEANPPAMYTMIGGLAMVFLFSSKSRNPLLRAAEGFQGLLGIVQVFSDVPFLLAPLRPGCGYGLYRSDVQHPGGTGLQRVASRCRFHRRGHYSALRPRTQHRSGYHGRGDPRTEAQFSRMVPLGVSKGTAWNTGLSGGLVKSKSSVKT